MDINQILDRASKLKIAVIGDLIIDHYIYGTVDRISPEAPVPVLVRGDMKTTLGGAGNVLMNLIGLGVDAELFCNFIGNPFWDPILYDKIHCHEYPGSIKTRVMCGNHHLLRIDEEIPWKQLSFLNANQFSWWQDFMDRFLTFDVIILSDYNKGVCSDSVATTVKALQVMARGDNKFIRLIADAKRDYSKYRGYDILKCNKKEAEDNHVFEIEGLDILKSISWTVVTLGDEGILALSHPKEGWGNFTEIMSLGHKVNIVDVCGAGDTVTAALSIMLPEAYSIEEAMDLANIAASEVCKYPGVVPITKDLLLKRME